MHNLEHAKISWKALKRYLNLSEISRSLGLGRTATQQWEFVPEKHVDQISELLQIEPSKLRPDLFGKEGDFFRPVPLDASRETWGLERTSYPGILLAKGMYEGTATLWANSLNEGKRTLNDIPEEFRS